MKSHQHDFKPRYVSTFYSTGEICFLIRSDCKDTSCDESVYEIQIAEEVVIIE